MSYLYTSIYRKILAEHKGVYIKIASRTAMTCSILGSGRREFSIFEVKW